MASPFSAAATAAANSPPPLAPLSSSPSTTTAAAATLRPAANVKRTRSTPSPRPTMSSQYLASQQHLAESSADEITPIIGQEHGRGRGYRGTESKSTDNRTADSGTTEASQQLRTEERSEESEAGPRRRIRERENSKGRRGQNGTTAGERKKGKKGWSRWFEKYGSIELENKGSVARDHLALERTFLAWLRTSLAFASIGIAITQLFRLNTTITDREGLVPDPNQSSSIHLRQVGKPLGATFLGIAILVLAIGWRRYFESQHWIIKGKFPASRGSVFLITFVAAALIVTSLVVVVTVGPTTFEKK